MCMLFRTIVFYFWYSLLIFYGKNLGIEVVFISLSINKLKRKNDFSN
jgi:hypothetical protein